MPISDFLRSLKLKRPAQVTDLSAASAADPLAGLRRGSSMMFARIGVMDGAGWRDH
jgi:hypothetical protein